MFRTLFTLGAFALAGLFVLRLVTGIFGGLFGLFFGLLGLAFKILLIGAVVYFVVRLFSPDTARRWEERFGQGGGGL